jgi:hypothetical protein
MRIWLLLRRLRLRQWYKTWLGIEKGHKILQFITHSVHIFSNKNRTVQNHMNKIVSACVLTLVRFKNFALLYSRVGAAAASKFSPGAGAA